MRWRPGKTKTTDLAFRAVLCMVSSSSLLLATPAGAAGCQAKESCDEGQYSCSSCAGKSRNLCAGSPFCEWPPSCISKSKCCLKEASPVQDLYKASTLEDLCSSTNSPESCKAMDMHGVGFCEWKDDHQCRRCANFSANRDCVSRDFCEWDQGTLPTYPITTADIIFVVAGLLCELWTSCQLLYHVSSSTFPM